MQKRHARLESKRKRDSALNVGAGRAKSEQLPRGGLSLSKKQFNLEER